MCKADREDALSPVVTLARINALAAEQFACYVMLERLAQEQDNEGWDEVAAPVLERLRQIEGQLWQAWEERKRCH